MKNKTKQNIEKLKAVLSRDSTVKLAYLFGSHATGKNTALSDIDIAVLLDCKLNKKKIFEKELELIGKLSELFSNIDLVVLNENIDLLLKYNIIKTGTIIKNSALRPEFEFHVMNEYLDNEYHERMRAEILINRFSERGLE
jgi:predicted nucleotidyltransferase